MFMHSALNVLPQHFVQVEFWTLGRCNNSFLFQPVAEMCRRAPAFPVA